MPAVRIEKEKTEQKAWFSQKISENMDALYALALRLTRNSADAEDLVAESVTKAWCALTSLDDKNRFRPWIFRILHNGFISDYRKKAAAPGQTQYEEAESGQETQEIAELLIEQPNEFLSWWANPEKVFFDELLTDEIIAAIETLPKEFQLTVVLINVEGFSYDEVAEILGVSPGTIRSRMNRGRTLLQKALWQLANDAGIVTYQHTVECSK